MRVIDGDTIVVAGVHVRLNGIDAEEVAHPGYPVADPHGEAARAVMQEIVGIAHRRSATSLVRGPTTASSGFASTRWAKISAPRLSGAARRLIALTIAEGATDFLNRLERGPVSSKRTIAEAHSRRVAGFENPSPPPISLGGPGRGDPRHPLS